MFLSLKRSGEEEKTDTGWVKTSNNQYSPLIHRPAIVPCPKAPKGDELICSPKMTKEYIEGDLLSEMTLKNTLAKVFQPRVPQPRVLRRVRDLRDHQGPESQHQDSWKGLELWHAPVPDLVSYLSGIDKQNIPIFSLLSVSVFGRITATMDTAA